MLIYPRKMKADMGKAYQNQKKTAQPKRETNALPTQRKINIINRKQFLIYKEALKSICTYGIQLWGSASIPTLESSSIFNPRLSDPFCTHLGI
jgi:hypothetical protein